MADTVRSILKKGPIELFGDVKFLGGSSALFDLVNEYWTHRRDSSSIWGATTEEILGDTGAEEGKLILTAIAPYLAIASVVIDPFLRAQHRQGIMDVAGEAGRAAVEQFMREFPRDRDAIIWLLKFASNGTPPGSPASLRDAHRAGPHQRSGRSNGPSAKIPRPTTRVAETQHPNTSQRGADPPDAARGLRVESITDPVLPAKILILNAPSNPPETLHGTGVVVDERGKCEEEAKRVLELDTKLEDLRCKLDELERERDDERERTKDCPELYQQNEDLRMKRESLRAKLLPAEGRIRRDRENLSFVERQGWDASDLQSELYTAESDVRHLNDELANIERQWEKVRYELGKCPG